MVRIIALALVSALGVSTAFAGNKLEVPMDAPVVEPVATGSMGQRAALIGLGALALGGVIWAIADDGNDDDDDDNTATTTTAE